MRTWVTLSYIKMPERGWLQNGSVLMLGSEGLSKEIEERPEIFLDYIH